METSIRLDLLLKQNRERFEKLQHKLSEFSKDLLETSEKLKHRIQARDIIGKCLYIKKHEAKILIDIVNAGLAYVYPAKKMTFNIVFEEKAGRIIPEFYLDDLNLKPPFVGDGGGIISTISILLYLSMIRLKNRKFILIDEIDSMIDIDAASRLFSFIDVFAEENKFTIIAITHKKFQNVKEEKITEHIKVLKFKGG